MYTPESKYLTLNREIFGNTEGIVISAEYGAEFRNNKKIPTTLVGAIARIDNSYTIASNSYISLSTFNISATTYTIIFEATLNSLAGVYSSLASLNVNGSYRQNIFYSSDASYSNITIGYSSDSFKITIPTGIAVTGQKHKICIVRSGGTMLAYVNGVKATVTAGAPVANRSGISIIGQASATDLVYRWDGKIALFCAANKAISENLARELSINTNKVFTYSYSQVWLYALTLGGNTYNVGTTLNLLNSVASNNQAIKNSTIVLNHAQNLQNSNITSTLSSLDLTSIQGIPLLGSVNTSLQAALINLIACNTNNTVTTTTSCLLNLHNILNFDGELQASGNVDVNFSTGTNHTIATNNSLLGNYNITLAVRSIYIPEDSVITSNLCDLQISSTIFSNSNGFISSALSLSNILMAESSKTIELSGDILLTSIYENTTHNVLSINEDVNLTTSIAKHTLTTLITQANLTINFAILKVISGQNPKILTRIGTKEILFTFNTSNLHFIHASKATLFTSN